VRQSVAARRRGGCKQTSRAGLRLEHEHGTSDDGGAGSSDGAKATRDVQARSAVGLGRGDGGADGRGCVVRRRRQLSDGMGLKRRRDAPNSGASCETEDVMVG
jgi:hypothetical protein